MINLLPSGAKKGVRREYWLRVVTVWVLLLAVALLIGSLLLLPSYVLISAQVSVYEETANRVSAEVASYEDVSTALVQANQQSIFIATESKQNSFSDLVTLFNSFETERVNITDLQLSRTGVVVDVVQIDGTARDREALAQFRDELLADAAIASVDLPTSNLARAEDIPFSMTVALSVANQDGI